MLLAVERRFALVYENETSSITNILCMEWCIFRVSVKISKRFSRKKAVIFQIALQQRGDDF